MLCIVLYSRGYRGCDDNLVLEGALPLFPVIKHTLQLSYQCKERKNLQPRFTRNETYETHQEGHRKAGRYSMRVLCVNRDVEFEIGEKKGVMPLV